MEEIKMFDLKTLKLYTQLEMLQSKMANGIAAFDDVQDEMFYDKIVYKNNESPNVVNINRKQVGPLRHIKEIGDVYDTTIDQNYDIFINKILHPELTEENYDEIKFSVDDWYICKLYREKVSLRENPYAIVISNGEDNIIVTNTGWMVV